MLAVAYRVVGGLCAFCVNVFWLHLYGALTLFQDPSKWKGTPPPPGFGIVAAVFISAAIFSGYLLGACGFVAAKRLEERRGWTFCFVVSILYLFVQPVGTVLGIFSLIVLCRPTVKTLFGKMPVA